MKLHYDNQMLEREDEKNDMVLLSLKKKYYHMLLFWDSEIFFPLVFVNKFYQDVPS